MSAITIIMFRANSTVELAFELDSSIRYEGEGEDVQVPLDEIEIDENLQFVEKPIKIVKRDVKKLKRRRIPLVK
ncbi:hypothetical protein Tco_0666621, partial [Tanacetum coccineum]